MTAPTVDQILKSTAIGGGQHLWPVPGGSVMLKTADLRSVLENAHDSLMPNWPSMVELGD